MKGAKDEGFQTICVCTQKASKVYQSFGVADEILIFEDYNFNFKNIEKELIDRNSILIPHASLMKYLTLQEIRNLEIMYYGTKGILEWESDRSMERKWLKEAGLKIPNIFESSAQIDRPVIVKFNGAGGGKDYFIANSEKEFNKNIVKHNHKNQGYAIQEYIIGVPVYCHFFYSNLSKELEIMSFDKRYESNADSIGRIAAGDQVATDIKTTYTITGNIPMVVRESILPDIFEMGQQVIEHSKKIEPGGLFGPFCLEGVIDPELNFYIFEISARIVAGTNPYIQGSPYTWLKYKEPMSTGRRIARDIKQAIIQQKIDKILN